MSHPGHFVGRQKDKLRFRSLGTFCANDHKAFPWNAGIFLFQTIYKMFQTEHTSFSSKWLLTGKYHHHA
jgi:hypothetical protein